MKYVYKVWDELNSDKVVFTVETGQGLIRLHIPLVDPDDWIILTKAEARDLIEALTAALLDVGEAENAA